MTIPTFQPLSDAARDEFSECRTFVWTLASQLAEPDVPTHDERSLRALQRVALEFEAKQANEGAWIALGVVFGDALIELVPGLNWVMVSDEYGTQAALRFNSTSLNISAPTMLLKRAQRGEAVDLQHLSTELKAFVEAHAHEYE